MKMNFKFLVLMVFASTSLLLSACGTKSDPNQTGTLNGQITPAASITIVTVTDAAGMTTTTTPSSTGAYTFTGLAAGTYTISFTAATGYVAPASQTGVVITSGGTTTPPLTVVRDRASATFTVNGLATTPTPIVTGTLVSTDFSVTMVSNSGVTERSVVFHIDGFTGAAGTFFLDNQSNTATHLIYGELAGHSSQQWSTTAFLNNTQGSGTIVITSIGANPRCASGTFTATAYSTTNTWGSTRIVTGTFTNIAY